MVVQRSCKAKVEGSDPFFGTIYTESNAVGMVPRLALKTRSWWRIGWGSTPLLSTIIIKGIIMSGKGSRPRPFGVAQQEYDSRWDAIFARDIKQLSDEAIFEHEQKESKEEHSDQGPQMLFENKSWV